MSHLASESPGLGYFLILFNSPPQVIEQSLFLFFSLSLGKRKQVDIGSLRGDGNEAGEPLNGTRVGGGGGGGGGTEAPGGGGGGGEAAGETVVAAAAAAAAAGPPPSGGGGGGDGNGVGGDNGLAAG